jgi:hypothetical protein
VWDAWLHPSHPDVQAAAQEPPVLLTRNGLSYEMALAAVFATMGDAMPEEFAAVYLRGEPDPYLQAHVLPDGQRVQLEQLPMSYARYLIRRTGMVTHPAGMSLGCSGQTGGACSRDGTTLNTIQDGTSLDTLIRMADEHRPGCAEAYIPADERGHPELTVQKRAEVLLHWAAGPKGEASFAKLHRLDCNVWDAWLTPLRMQGKFPVEEPPVLVTSNGDGYEMALAAVFQAMGEEMPEEFGVTYVYRLTEAGSFD